MPMPATTCCRLASVAAAAAAASPRTRARSTSTVPSQPSVEAWATAYLGPGPWGSVAPALPSVPSQIAEGLGTGLVAVLMIGLLAAGAFARHDGRLFLVAAAGWLAVRLVVGATWRDPEVLGPLRTDQLISIALLVLVAIGFRRWPTPSTPEVSSGSPDPRRHEVLST